MAWGRRQWRGDSEGTALGIMLDDNRGGNLLIGLDELLEIELIKMKRWAIPE